jgi:hypothetical protein
MMIEAGNFVIDPINKIIKVKNKSQTKMQRYIELMEVFSRTDMFDLTLPLRVDIVIKQENDWKVEGFD